MSPETSTSNVVQENPNHVVVKKPFDLTFFIVSVLMAVFGAIIGLQLITTLGISPNTSVIGVLVAVLLARIPLQIFRKFRNIHNQNLIQTTVSAATFGAANSLLLPIGIPWALGRPDLVVPMLIGAAIALALDVFVLYKVFDSRLFGAHEAWPAGVASAETIKAGDEGGKKVKFLGIGILGGAVGAFFGVPMSAFGVAFIGNIWALSLFGLGLLARGYSVPVFNIDLNKLYVPHGMMIGAGLVALIQFIFLLVGKRADKERATPSKPAAGGTAETVYVPKAASLTRSDRDVRRALSVGTLLFILGAVLVAIMGGLITELSFGYLLLFVVFAAFASFMHQIIVGIAAMHSGWFPAFAVTLVVLLLGMLMGFPPVALALLCGYTAATGPAFADMGFDFKTGALLRTGLPVAEELYGRRLQLKSSIIGLAVAVVVVALAHQTYFAQDLLPPVDRVFAATINAGLDPSTGMQLALWAIPGALVQLIGGTKRQLGIMLATGLILLNPIAGWAVAAGVILRFLILKIKGREAEESMVTMAAGFIAGDALFSFFSSLWKVK